MPAILRTFNNQNISTLFIKILLIVLVVEGTIMVTFTTLPFTLNGGQEAFFDVLVLAMVSTPLVYLFGIRPYVKLTKAAFMAEEESKAKLMIANRDLEFQKLTLDEHAIVSIADVDGKINYANDKLCEISGYARQELIGKNHRILNAGFHSKAFFSDLWNTINKGDSWHGEIKNKAKNGTYYWVNATIVPFLDENGKPFQYVGVHTDITKQKTMEEALKAAQSVARMGSWSLDLTTNQLVWSDEVFNIFGINPENFGASLEAFFSTIHPDDLDYVKNQYEGSLLGGIPYDTDHRIIRFDTGEVRWVHEMCIHQYNDQGEVIRSDGTVQDITERIQAQDEIRRLAMTDQLTGLANRNQFHRRFDENLKLARREKQIFGLLLLDLDKFKPVNDTYGHQAGDELLIAVSKILQCSCREIDIVARLGGDEFAILLVHPVDIDAIKTVTQRLIAEINKPIDVFGKDINIGISIGVAQYPIDGIEQDSLIEKADKALYVAKKQGRNNFYIYNPEQK